MNRQQRRAAARQGRTQEIDSALIGEAIRHHQEGRLDQAAAFYLRVLVARPEDAEVLHLLGGLRLQQGDFSQAAELMGKAVALKPNFPLAYSNLSSALAELGRLDEAAAACRQGIGLAPAFAGAHGNLGVVLRKLNRHAEAELSLGEAIRLKPDIPESHHNLGVLLDEVGRLSEAEASFKTALRLRPDYRDARISLGVVLRQLCRAPEAEACLREVLRSSPNDADAHLNLACTLLLAGRLEEGWEHYEWRWRTKEAQAPRDLTAPLWNGEPIERRTILLHAEQGLGDTLQFCRYAPLIAARGAKVVLEVPPSLVRLLSRLPGVSKIVARGEPLPPFDLHCPLMSLPRAMATRLDTIPASRSYLAAEPALAAMWREHLAGVPGIKVGLVWAGQRPPDLAMAAIDARRSITLDMMAPLGVSGISFVSLQKGEAAVQAADPPAGMMLQDFTNELNDFADTAALIDGLDLVISVDTSVAHLAGALGKPVWLLNRFDTDWRWLLDRDDSPWYPSLRQFRQPRPLDWSAVIDAAKGALERLAAGDEHPSESALGRKRTQ